MPEEQVRDASIDPGMFNFQQVMNDFYGYKPKEGDEQGQAMKNAFQANMIQSAWDTQQSKDMAQTQAGLSMGAMSQAADLDLRNKNALMHQEFNFGQSSMGAQYDYQNTFADNQNERDIVQGAAQGEQMRKNMASQGMQNRLDTITQGEQQRLTDTNRAAAAGSETRATDSNRILTEGYANEELTKTTGEENRKGMVTSGEQQRETIGTQGQADRALVGAKGDQDVRLVGAQGAEQRASATHGNRLEAKTRADQSRYSRDMARSF